MTEFEPRYLSLEGRVIGPLTIGDLTKLSDLGILHGDSPVSRAGEWVLLKEQSDLVSLLTSNSGEDVVATPDVSETLQEFKDDWEERWANLGDFIKELPDNLAELSEDLKNTTDSIHKFQSELLQEGTSGEIDHDSFEVEKLEGKIDSLTLQAEELGALIRRVSEKLSAPEEEKEDEGQSGYEDLESTIEQLFEKAEAKLQLPLEKLISSSNDFAKSMDRGKELQVTAIESSKADFEGLKQQIAELSSQQEAFFERVATQKTLEAGLEVNRTQFAELRHVLDRLEKIDVDRTKNKLPNDEVLLLRSLVEDLKGCSENLKAPRPTGGDALLRTQRIEFTEVMQEQLRILCVDLQQMHENLRSRLHDQLSETTAPIGLVQSESPSLLLMENLPSPQDIAGLREALERLASIQQGQSLTFSESATQLDRSIHRLIQGLTDRLQHSAK